MEEDVGSLKYTTICNIALPLYGNRGFAIRAKELPGSFYFRSLKKLLAVFMERSCKKKVACYMKVVI